MAGNRSQRGVVFPSPVVMLSIIAIALAAVAFVATRGGDAPEREVATTVRQTQSATTAPVPTPSPSASESPRATAPPKPKKTKEPVQRDAVFVEVYNNAGITGLADRVGGSAASAGWNVVGTDNWYGTVPTNTVYFPGRLERQADQLALDLGIGRVMPAIGAMKGDRLTVILTGEL